MTPISVTASTAGEAGNTWRRGIWALAAATCLVGAVYAFVTPPGLPYDEPSQWATVQYYAQHDRLPVLGDREVTYEAQMGPVAYVADAAIVRVSDWLGLGSETAFRLVRLFGVLQLAALVVVLGALLTRVVRLSTAGLLALAVVALNPMLLTMSASVQNDSLALLLGVLVIYLALERLSDQPRTGMALAFGCLAGLGVLTKLTDWVVVVVVAAWLLWIHGRQAFGPAAAFLCGAAVVCGWWFVRNLALYGDPTSASAVTRTGVSFERYHLARPGDLGHVIEQVVTYLWLPTEYLRNVISAPAPLKGTLLVITVAVALFGGHRLSRPNGFGVALIGGTAAVSVATWLLTYVSYQSVAPRVAYLALPFWVCVVALAVGRLHPRAAVAVTFVLLAALNVWCLAQIRSVDAPHFIEFG